MDVKKANQMYDKMINGKQWNLDNLNLMAKAFWKAGKDSKLSMDTRKFYRDREKRVIDEILKVLNEIVNWEG